MWNCLKVTLKNDGVIRGLYAGTTPAIMANVAENSVLFAAYGYCQKFVCRLSGVEVYTIFLSSLMFRICFSHHFKIKYNFISVYAFML